jgi:hypothetical protein
MFCPPNTFCYLGCEQKNLAIVFRSIVVCDNINARAFINKTTTTGRDFLMTTLPALLLEVTATSVVALTNWPSDTTEYAGKPYQWTVSLTIIPQVHSSEYTPTAFAYNGLDVTVGDWVSNLDGGRGWKIDSISAATATSVTCVLEDVNQVNTFADTSGSGNGAPPTGTVGTLFIQSGTQAGLPISGPTGPSGPIGPTGPASTVTGPRGGTGAIGAQGATGPTGITSYSFTVNFSGTALTSGQTIVAPSGWTITATSGSTLNVVHNLGKQPANGLAYGLLSGNYTCRPISGAALYISFTSASGNSCLINGVSSTSTAAGSGSSAILYLIF